MIVHKIKLGSFLAYGSVQSSIANSELRMTTCKSINTLFSRTDTPIQSYLYLPDRYKLPFRIDMTVKIDSPALYLLVGKGHIGIGTDGMDNRSITSIAGGEFKTRRNRPVNSIPMGEYASISGIFGNKAMQLVINGKSRYYTTADPYMKSPLLKTEFLEGFSIKLACDKRTNLVLNDFNVVEYGDSEPEFYPVSPDEPPAPCLSGVDKPTMEDCIRGLSDELRQVIVDLDRYLLEIAKGSLKFKRKIEGGYPYGKITYVSPLGLSYRMNISDAAMAHSMGWIDYNTRREQARYGGTKKADYSIAVLDKLAESSPEFANEIYHRMKECSGCNSGFCIHRTDYIYRGVRKTSCGGTIQFKMVPTEFEDVKAVLEAVRCALQGKK